MTAEKIRIGGTEYLFENQNGGSSPLQLPKAPVYVKPKGKRAFPGFDPEAQKRAEEKAKEPKKAPGTSGRVRLYYTDPRDAAKVMALTADQSGIPINELKFISIMEQWNPES